jgi:hypothetical protein
MEDRSLGGSVPRLEAGSATQSITRFKIIQQHHAGRPIASPAPSFRERLERTLVVHVVRIDCISSSNPPRPCPPRAQRGNLCYHGVPSPPSYMLREQISAGVRHHKTHSPLHFSSHRSSTPSSSASIRPARRIFCKNSHAAVSAIRGITDAQAHACCIASRSPSLGPLCGRRSGACRTAFAVVLSGSL